MTYVAKQISRRRRELGYTKDELAIKIGYMTRASINKIESGINDVPWYRLELIAEALNCTPDYLTESEDKHMVTYNGVNCRGDWLLKTFRKATDKEKKIVFSILSEYATDSTDDVDNYLLMLYQKASPKDRAIVYTILSEYIIEIFE